MMGWMRKVWAHCRWKRIEGAAIFNEESFAVHRMTVWGQLPSGHWVVKRPLTVPASGTALYLTFRVANERRAEINIFLEAKHVRNKRRQYSWRRFSMCRSGRATL